MSDIEPAHAPSRTSDCNPQVQNDTHFRQKRPGEAYDREESDKWQDKALEFVKNTDETPQERAKRTQKLFSVAPRTAAFHRMRLLENALVSATGAGFESFDNAIDLEGYKVSEQPIGEDLSGAATGGQRIADEVLRLPCPRCLVVTGDQDGKQWAGFNYMKNALKLCFEGVRDPYYRKWNDLSGALRRAGFYCEYLHTTVVMNTRYGPWQNSTWYRQLQETSLNASAKMLPDDPVLLLVWEGIVEEKQYYNLDYFEGRTGRDARQWFLEGIANSKCIAVKGPKVAPSTWFSWMAAFQLWDSEFHTQMVLQVMLCLEQGWSRHHTDLFEPLPDVVHGAAHENDRTATQGEAMGTVGGGSGSKASSSTVASSARASGSGEDHQPTNSDGAPPPAKTAKRSAYQQAREKYDRLRAKAANTCHSTTRLMCSHRLWDDSRLLFFLAQPEWSEYTQWCKSGLTRANNTQDTYIAWAHSSWLKPLIESESVLRDLTKLGHAGFRIVYSASAKKSTASAAPRSLRTTTGPSARSSSFRASSARE